jgi:hypothetical protein
MNELVMMEAALFQLRNAIGEDPMLMPIRISADVLGNALATAKAGGMNAARVNDIEFALNDLIAAVDDTGAPDEVYAAIALLQNDAAALRAASALPKELITAIRDLQAKLKARAKALERNQYRVEDAAAEPLPYPPAELREAAIPLARQLAAAGFETPSLDELIARPAEVRYHNLNEIVDELDVIAGT